MYRIKDELGFAVRLEEWRRSAAEGGGWVPFEADDVQVELRMLDPYVRKALKHLG
jgi:oligosaccharyltransferase complex subunit beta